MAELAAWPLRRWVTALLVAVAVALVTGIATDLVPTSLYRRMTPVVWWNYPIWAVSALLSGLVAATFVRVGPRAPRARGAGSAFGGGVGSFFAVGCPICNKLVVAALGASGALSYFGPIQPFLGVASLGLLAGVLALRLRGLVACAVEPPRRV
ncbi:MAG: hypothetical protein H0V20_09930 [Actinobacteria bacterium]|nr:hypothetical protein [Actinomycetota bacterium]